MWTRTTTLRRAILFLLLSVPARAVDLSGLATVRSRQFGEIQLRMVNYSASYIGDHWCDKGHLTFVVAGQMVIEHKDGRTLTLPAGTSYHVADNDGPPHRARSEHGATVFVVD